MDELISTRIHREVCTGRGIRSIAHGTCAVYALAPKGTMTLIRKGDMKQRKSNSFRQHLLL